MVIKLFILICKNAYVIEKCHQKGSGGHLLPQINHACCTAENLSCEGLHRLLLYSKPPTPEQVASAGGRHMIVCRSAVRVKGLIELHVFVNSLLSTV